MNLFFRKPHFSKHELTQIRDAISTAETCTNGEIRVYVEKHCKAEHVLDRAALCFNKLEMHKTENRNAVLIYLAMKDRKFAIIGDSGINAVVTENFWEEEKNILQQHFKNGKMVEGICQCVATMGKHLQKYFPHQAGESKNELSNDVVIG